MPIKIKTLEEHLDNYIPEPNSGCWLWLGGMDAGGYGTFGYQAKGENYRKTLKAHRESYRYRCEDPGELKVLHHCDTRCCINPLHLYAGTQAQNVADMDRRGRRVRVFTRGELHGMAKLTSADILEIRQRCANGETQQFVGKDYGIHQATVSKIINRSRW